MDTARYRAFLTVAEEGSIKAAADRMGYTPSGVSQLISAIEREFGLVLMFRGKSGITLSYNGEKLLPIMREIVARENELYQIVTETKGLVTGEVTIASYSSVATFWLPKVLASFRKDYPGIKIRLKEGSWKDMDSWLREKRIDLAFTTITESLESFCDCFPLAEDRMMILLSKNHPLSNKRELSLEEIKNEELILTQDGNDPEVEFLTKQYNVPLDIWYTCKEPYSSLAMIENGLGAGIMNELITTDWKNRIAVIPIIPKYEITLGIAVPSLNAASPASNCFIKYAVERLTKSK